MSEGRRISQLDVKDTFPRGSKIIIESGDGDGTVAITKETLMESTNKELEIGDLSELPTLDKTSIVGALKEIASSSLEVIDTKEAVMANTATGRAAGALALKQYIQQNFTHLVGSSAKTLLENLKDILVPANIPSDAGSYLFCTNSSEGMYIISATHYNDYYSGFLYPLSTADISPYTFRRKVGADPVLKKLGNAGTDENGINVHFGASDHTATRPYCEVNNLFFNQIAVTFDGFKDYAYCDVYLQFSDQSVAQSQLIASTSYNGNYNFGKTFITNVESSRSRFPYKVYSRPAVSGCTVNLNNV